MLKELSRRILVVFIEYVIVMMPGLFMILIASDREFMIRHFFYYHRGPFAMFLLSPGTMGWSNWPWLWWTTALVTIIICILAYVIYPNKVTGIVSFFGIVGWFVFALSFVMWTI